MLLVGQDDGADCRVLHPKMQPNFPGVHSMGVVQVQDVEALLETEKLVELAVLRGSRRGLAYLLALARHRWIAVIL